MYRIYFFSFFLVVSLGFFWGNGADAASCSGGGRSGSCLAACTSPSDLISPASGCATGESCCASAAATGGAGAGGGMTTISIDNPVAFNTVESLLSGGILPWLRGTIATIALVFFVIGAIMYMAGGADESNVKQGKAAMTASLIGFTLALAVPSLLKEIYGIFGVSAPSAGPALVSIALNILRFLVSLVGILGTIMLVISGISYMGSAGSDEKAKSAKKMATYSVIGIALALAALIIIRQVTKLLS